MSVLQRSPLLFAILALVFCCCAEPSALEVTYLGNEGFLVRCGSQAVLFDALFGKGLPDYDRVPESVITQMDAGRSPFHKIDAIFISHVHPDHFDATSTMSFLRGHPSTLVFAPLEVATPLQKALDVQGGAARVVALQAKSVSTRISNGIHVEVFPLIHGSVQNLAYLVTLDGRKVLHLGDADLPMSNIASLNLRTRTIDLAFIPFWQLTENAAVVREQIRAKVIIPMHLITHPTTPDSKAYLEHVGGFDGMLRTIRAVFPNAAIFRKPLETRTF